MSKADSVKQRLQNKADRTGTLFQDELVLYALERVVFRISISQYSDRFTLKGAIFLYAYFNGSYSRATQDIDLLATRISNDVQNVKDIFSRILKIENDDAIQFDVSSIQAKNIAGMSRYHGINLSFFGYLGRTRIPVSIDIGFSDHIYPAKAKINYPVLLSDMSIPEIYAYSTEAVIAEKFEAIVSLGYANSRFKDFYDIYVLASARDYDGYELYCSLTLTFGNRGTGFGDIVAFDDSFCCNERRVERWHAFIRKKKAMVKAEFAEVISLLKKFLIPPVQAIQEKNEFSGKWDHLNRKWDL